MQVGRLHVEPTAARWAAYVAKIPLITAWRSGRARPRVGPPSAGNGGVQIVQVGAFSVLDRQQRCQDLRDASGHTAAGCALTPPVDSRYT